MAAKTCNTQDKQEIRRHAHKLLDGKWEIVLETYGNKNAEMGQYLWI
jgi:hypothetical protein